MRIIHYVTSTSRSAGGLYYSVSGLAKAQKALGADVSIVGGADETFEGDRHIWGDLPISTHPHKSKNAYSFYPEVALRLLRARPDILHIHGIWSGTSVYGRIASAAGIATVDSPRGMLDKWILKRRGAFKAVHGALFERPFLKNSAIHALNDSEKEAVTAYFAPHPVRVFVVPNGVDLPDTPPADNGRSGALYVGRLHEKKQVLELISHWAAHPSLRNVTLKIAGWGSPEYEAQVTMACNAAPNIHFVGQAYGAEKAALVAQAAFFILPSLSEGLPMAVLEGLAGGCIPVITRECNLPEMAETGSAISMRSDFSDFTAVAERIARSLPEDLLSLRRRGAQDILRYGWPSIAGQILGHYEDFLRARTSRNGLG